MQRSFKRLERVLALEAKQGYQNKAVVGGIRQFALYWVEQARGEAVDEADRAFVEQTAQVLADYGRLPGPDARRKSIEQLRQKLAGRAARVEKSPEPAAESAPSPPPKPKPEPEPAPSPPPQAEKTPPPTAVSPDPAALSQKVTAIRGVGAKTARRLGRLGAETIWDMLYLFPRRYDDYTEMKPINQLEYGEQVTVIGTIWETRARRTRSNQTLVQTVISDGTGAVQASWFNQPWLAEKLKAGKQIVVSGKVDQYLGRPVFSSPEWEALEMEPLRTRRIVPVYPLTSGLSGNKMRDLMQTAVDKWSHHVPDPLPESIRIRQKLYPLPAAIQQIHFPDSQESLHQARRRIIFDELFLLQLGMQGKRQEWQDVPGIPIPPAPHTLQQFYDALPFSLTAAQERVIEEITNDMARPVPMNRLLQGDVGAGKTLVAAAAMLVAVNAGAQAAMMAPTEILAEQHYAGLHPRLEAMDVSVALLTGSLTAGEKTAVYQGLAEGEIDVVIGTHALIQEGVIFQNLGLAVIDEQHRFGVDQRGALREKGTVSGNGEEAKEANPHLLVMSATPIPRSLALSLYGDLDLSLLDEMPPGRQEIATHWLRSAQRERAYAFVRRQAKEGRQAFIIYPLVEESDKIDAKAAVAEYERLQAEVFPELEVGLVHGRLSNEEKEATMRAFHAGEIDVLVATSVIEVGVDVPNAAVIMIENANRFGLAQLHQFRGRVGRGRHKSYCILVADDSSSDAEERLRALEQTNDGFQLAEKDLEIRGPGEFFGRKQSGLPELQLASLLNMEVLEAARREAIDLFADDPYLQEPGHTLLQEQVSHFWEDAGDVS